MINYYNNSYNISSVAHYKKANQPIIDYNQKYNIRSKTVNNIRKNMISNSLDKSLSYLSNSNINNKKNYPTNNNIKKRSISTTNYHHHNNTYNNIHYNNNNNSKKLSSSQSKENIYNNNNRLLKNNSMSKIRHKKIL